jgi:hypothetical protein
VVSRNVSVLGERTLFTCGSADFSLRAALSLPQRENMAWLVTGRDILLHVGLATLAGHGVFCLRRGHCHRKSK